MSATIIICTHNRAAALAQCLTAVAKSIAVNTQESIEILVIDNNSTDNTQAVVASWAAEHPDINFRAAFEPMQGLSHARNRGLQEAQGDLLIMIDDDCVMQPDYISVALAYDAADTQPVLRGGSVFLGDPTDQPLTIKTNSKSLSWALKDNVARHENLGDSLLGCNMIMRKELTENVGLFDTLLGAGSKIPGGEDTDYIIRCYISGYKIEYAPDLRINHFHGRKLVEDGYKLFRGYSIGSGALYAKYLFTHPNMCRQLYWDIQKLPKEFVTGRNQFMTEFNFSMANKVGFCIMGMYYYWLSRLSNAFQRKSYDVVDTASVGNGHLSTRFDRPHQEPNKSPPTG